MGYAFKNQADFNCFFVTTSFHQHVALGSVPGMYNNLGSTLQFCLKKYGGSLIGYVFMPTHLHMIVMIQGKLLSPLMRDCKKLIAQKVCPKLGIVANPVWEVGYDRVAIVSEQALLVKLRYIHSNPPKAGLVAKPEDWRWSSASTYQTGTQGPLAICTDWME